MKKVITMAALMMAFAVSAQTKVFDPRTGDSKLDKAIKDIDETAKKDIKVFTQDVAIKFEIPKTKVEEMIKTIPAGDIYMIAQTSEITKKPIDEVKKTYEANKGKGWGATAKELGIKPGSAEFHALKDKVNAHGKQKGDKEKKDKGSKQNEGKGKADTEKDEKAGGKGKGKK